MSAKESGCGFCVCVLGTAEGHVPNNKAKGKRSDKREKNVRNKSETKSTVTFNNMRKLCGDPEHVFVCVLPEIFVLIVKSRQTIKARHPV